MAVIQIGKIPDKPVETQCKKPKGIFGRFVLWKMNKSHSRLTDWGLTHVTVEPRFVVLDVGCGGGRTVSKLAAMAGDGKVCGIDYSEESVTASKRYNSQAIRAGSVEIHQADIAQLPFPDNTFDLVTGVETHFWWPDITVGVSEIRRVLKAGGTLILIAEVYKGANTTVARLCEKYAPITGIKMLTADEHRELLASTGFGNIKVDTVAEKGWISTQATK